MGIFGPGFGIGKALGGTFGSGGNIKQFANNIGSNVKPMNSRLGGFFGRAFKPNQRPQQMNPIQNMFQLPMQNRGGYSRGMFGGNMGGMTSMNGGMFGNGSSGDRMNGMFGGGFGGGVARSHVMPHSGGQQQPEMPQEPIGEAQPAMPGEMDRSSMWDNYMQNRQPQMDNQRRRLFF